MERNMRDINKLIYLYFLDLKRLISRIYAIISGGVTKSYNNTINKINLFILFNVISR